MYRFRNIDVSGLGAFDSKQSLYFPDGLTMIIAGNGMGKSTIVKKLRQEFHQGTEQADTLAGNAKILTPFIFFDEKTHLPIIGTPWEPLISLILYFNEFFVVRDQFEKYVTKYIQKLLSDKLKGISKFSHIAKSSEQLYASVDLEGAINMRANQNTKDINHCFQAEGERIILYLSVNMAIRRLFLLDIPFVVNSRLGTMELSLYSPFLQFIQEMSEQNIVFESPYLIESLELKADFQLVSHPVSGKTMIDKLV